MKIIVARSIKKKEFGKEDISESDLQTILRAYAKGLFVVIKGSNLPVGSRLIKIYATTEKGARRIVFLVDVASGDGFLLFYRDKKDRIGHNISILNPLFKEALHKYLCMLVSDLENNLYDKFEF